MRTIRIMVVSGSVRSTRSIMQRSPEGRPANCEWLCQERICSGHYDIGTRAVKAPNSRFGAFFVPGNAL